MYNLKTYDFVRVAHDVDKEEIRGRPAMFLEYVRTPGDVQRAKILVSPPDASEWEEWLVKPSCLLPF